MKRRIISMLMLTGMLALGLQTIFVYPVLAAKSPAKKPEPVAAITDIMLTGPGKIDLGDPFTIDGILKDQKGNRISQKTITIAANGVYLSQASTKMDGTFHIVINKDLPAGLYLVAAHFNGAHLLEPTTVYTQLEILPAVLKVQTVPAVAGVTFEVDGHQFVSDENGLASTKINQTGLYRLQVLIDEYHNPSQRIEFGRWLQESYQPFMDIRIPTKDAIQVGLNVYHQVNQTFTDIEGNQIDTHRITGITIKSSQGDNFNIKEGQSTWVPAIRTARRHTGLEETKLLYSVISVTIDGSSVVNQAQQRFFANPNDNWSISLLLYSLHVEVKDALFGIPIGETVSLDFPDGKIVDYPLDNLKKVDIRSLARGIYHINVTGINGLHTTIPVALSRNTQVNVSIVTYLDLAVAGTIGVITALGLVIYGRPWLIGNLLKKKPRFAKELVRATFHEN
jgi:hypothetical protein